MIFCLTSVLPQNCERYAQQHRTHPSVIHASISRGHSTCHKSQPRAFESLTTGLPRTVKLLSTVYIKSFGEDHFAFKGNWPGTGRTSLPASSSQWQNLHCARDIFQVQHNPLLPSCFSLRTNSSPNLPPFPKYALCPQEAESSADR